MTNAMAVSSDAGAERRPGTSNAAARWLLAVEIFLAGGLVALLLVRQLLLTIMGRLISAAAQAEILNVLDQLLPYYVAYGLALLSVGLLTVWAWLWSLGASQREG